MGIKYTLLTFLSSPKKGERYTDVINNNYDFITLHLYLGFQGFMKSKCPISDIHIVCKVIKKHKHL